MKDFRSYGITDTSVLGLEEVYGPSLSQLENETKRDLMFCLLSLWSVVPDETSEPGDLDPEFQCFNFLSEEETLKIVKAIANTPCTIKPPQASRLLLQVNDQEVKVFLEGNWRNESALRTILGEPVSSPRGDCEYAWNFGDLGEKATATITIAKGRVSQIQVWVWGELFNTWLCDRHCIMGVPPSSILLSIIKEVVSKVAVYGNSPIDIMLKKAGEPDARISDEEIEEECLKAFAAYYLIRKHYSNHYFDYEVVNNLPRALPYQGRVNGWALTQHPGCMKDQHLEQLEPYIEELLKP